MTELDRQYIIKEVLSSLQEGKDFTIQSLSELVSVSQSEVSRKAKSGLVHGVYKVGRRFRFIRSVILQRRATGQNIFKEKK